MESNLTSQIINTKWGKKQTHVEKHYTKIKVREYRRGNQKWTIQKKLATQSIQYTEKQNKTQHNMYWTPLCTNKHKYMLKTN